MKPPDCAIHWPHRRTFSSSGAKFAAQHPIAHHHFHFADLARFVEFHRGQVLRAEALLESELDGLLRVGLLGRLQQPLHTRDVGARRLLTVDVLVRADRGFEVFGMQVDRCRDQHCV